MSDSEDVWGKLEMAAKDLAENVRELKAIFDSENPPIWMRSDRMAWLNRLKSADNIANMLTDFVNDHIPSDDLEFWTNGIDYVIARSMEDAVNITAELCQMTPEEVLEEGGDCDWITWAMDREFTFYDDDTDTKIKKPVAEWIKEHGRGYFACSEW